MKRIFLKKISRQLDASLICFDMVSAKALPVLYERCVSGEYNKTVVIYLSFGNAMCKITIYEIKMIFVI